MISKIISGGQTGADRGGLDAAINTKVPHGGFCPKGRRAEDGIIPEKYYQQETRYSGYADRTELNVTSSDGTLVFTIGDITKGSKMTIDFAQYAKKPYLHVNLAILDQNSAVQEVVQWINKTFSNNPFTLNIAGSRESLYPGIQSKVSEVMTNVIRIVNSIETTHSNDCSFELWLSRQTHWVIAVSQSDIVYKAMKLAYESHNTDVSILSGESRYAPRECSADFKAGFSAAMRDVLDRLPSPEYSSDPMTPREVSKLLSFVKSHLPNAISEDRQGEDHE